MKGIFVADVGDGLCMAINTISGEIIQIDWGSQEGGRTAFTGFKKIHYYLRSPDVFILSHFHVDHYNGLLYASINLHEYSSFRIREVYYPRVPEFKERKKFIDALCTMNLRVFGSETGVMEYDFLKAISRVNRISFKYKPLTKGDIININGSVFEVLWPPAVIDDEGDDEGTLTVIRQALKDFEKVLKEDETTRQLYNRVKEEGVFESYLEEGEKTPELEELNDRYTDVNEKRRLPEIVKKANESLRKAANHLSLALFEDNRFLFLGDAENFEIRQIVNDLKSKGRKNFYVFITPHHGTHWDNSLREIECIYSITSNGNKLYSRMKTHFKEIAKRSLATYVNGDIMIPLVVPLRKKIVVEHTVVVL